MQTANAAQVPLALERAALETPHPVLSPATAEKPVEPAGKSAGCGMCGPGPLSRGWVAKRRSWIVLGALAVAGTGVALGEGWVTVAALAPILYILPCAVMMLFCMKGINRGTQAQQEQAAPPVPLTNIADGQKSASGG